MIVLITHYIVAHVIRSFSVIVTCVLQGGTMLGPPDTVVDLGETEVSEDIFMDYLSSLGESTYRFSKFLSLGHRQAYPLLISLAP